MIKNVFLIGPSRHDNNLSMNYYLKKLASSNKNYFYEFNVINYSHGYNFFLQNIPIPSNIKIHLYKYFFLKLNNNFSDIIHYTDHVYYNLLFKKKSKIIVTVHDIIPFLAWKKLIPNLNYPHFPLFFYLSMKSLKYADKIIVVSTNTKNDLIKHFNVDEKKIRVIHLGIDDIFKEFSILEKLNARKKFNLNDDSFKILLTGDQIYKNHATAIEIIKEFAKNTTRRIHVIKSGKCNNILENSFSNTSIRYSNIFCKDVFEMSELYNSVDCLLFPSNYEGFGLPPLEAMACGLPVLTSDISVFKEIIPEYLTKLPLSNINDFVYNMLKIMLDQDFKDHLIQIGFKIAEKYTWEKTTSKTYQVYTETFHTS
jgi:glycosyltransferase involved in cell wall biosynthesis